MNASFRSQTFRRFARAANLAPLLAAAVALGIAAPAMMGGSIDRARQHFQEALAMSKGKRASTYVTMAENVSVQTQNRKEFTDLLNQALAIDPDADRLHRLENLVVQKRARWLLSRADELFLDTPADSAGAATTNPH